MSLFVSLLATPTVTPTVPAPARPAAPSAGGETIKISGDEVKALFSREYNECTSFEQAVSSRAASIAEKILLRTSEFQAFNTDDQKTAAVEYLGGKIRAAVSGETFHDLLANNRRWHDWECHSSGLTGALTLRNLPLPWIKKDIFDLKVPVQELNNAIAEGNKKNALPAPPPPYKPPAPEMTQINPASIPADSGPVDVKISGYYPASTFRRIDTSEDTKCKDAITGLTINTKEIKFTIDPKGLGGRTCKIIADNVTGEVYTTLQITQPGISAPPARRPASAPVRPAPAPAPRPAAPPPPAPAPARPKPAAPPPPPPPPAPAEGVNPFEL